jgi:hypothetical protein
MSWIHKFLLKTFLFLSFLILTLLTVNSGWGKSERQIVFFEVASVPLIRQVPDYLLLRFAIANLAVREIKLKRITLENEQGKILAYKSYAKEIPQLGLDIDPPKFKRFLTGGRELLQPYQFPATETKKIFYDTITLKKRKFRQAIAADNTLKFQITAEFSVEGLPYSLIRTHSIKLAQALPKPGDGDSYWVAGDAHIHTKFSGIEDGLPPWLSPFDRAQEASVAGLGWIYITDHAPNMGEKEWLSLVEECQRAQQTGIIVLPGLELSTRDVDERVDKGGNSNYLPPYDSHYLAYGLNYFIKQGKTLGERFNQDWTGQKVIDATINNFPNVSFGTIAHPLSPIYPWFPWWNRAQGYSALELINGSDLLMNGVEMRNRNVDKWQQILTEQLAETVATGKFVAGTANSDVHFGFYTENFTQTVTYAAVPDPDKFTYFDINKALKSGRLVASQDGSLAFFKLNGKSIGEVASLKLGEPIKIEVSLFPVDNHKVRRIRLISNYASVSFPARKTTFNIVPNNRGDFPYPNSNSFFRLEVDFTFRGKTYTTYTNPVFLQLETVSTPPNDNNQTILRTDIEPDFEGIYRKRPIITLFNTNSEIIFYRWDTGKWQRYKRPFEAPLGVHLLSYYAKSDTYIRTKEFVVKPKTSVYTDIASNSLGWYTQGTPLISIINPEANKIYYQWDSPDGNWQIYKGPFYALPGVHTLYFYADIDEPEVFQKTFRVGAPPDQLPEGLAWRWTMPAYNWVAIAEMTTTASEGECIRTYIWTNKIFSWGYVNLEIHAFGGEDNYLGAVNGATLFPHQVGWHKLEVVGKMPPKTAYTRVSLMVFNYNLGTVYFDAWGFTNYERDDWRIAQFDFTPMPFVLDNKWRPEAVDYEFEP